MQQPAPLEKELKYALSAKSYARLMAALAGPGARPGVRVERQHNVYFDDEGLALRRQRFGLRIRLIDDDRAVVAVKYPPAREADSPVASFKIRQEIEAPLDISLARAIINGEMAIGAVDSAPIEKLREIFPRTTIDDLRPIGDLRTERTIVPFGDGLDLEIDACRTLGRLFFELEVETDHPQETDRRIRHLLAEHRIPYRPLRRSKLARVFTTIREQQRHLARTKELQRKK